MRTAFLKRTLPLIITGIALGLLARAIFNVEPPNDSKRRFNRPIGSDLQEGNFSESPDIMLDESFDSASE